MYRCNEDMRNFAVNIAIYANDLPVMTAWETLFYAQQRLYNPY